MKHLLLLLLTWGSACVCLAQAPDSAALRINRLPPTTGLLLQKGWRYHAGDDPIWARPGFDASRWDTLNPTWLRAALPPALSRGISWLRLRVRLGDSLRRHQLVLVVPASSIRGAAWELYLNGQLVQRQGVLAANPAQVRPTGSPIAPVEIPANGPADLVLAVRLAPWQPPLVQDMPRDKLLMLSLVSGTHFWARDADQKVSTGIIFNTTGGVVGLLMLLHLAFFYYNPARRANLYFALYTGTLALAALGTYYCDVFSFPTAGWYLVAGDVPYFLLGLSALWAVRALYALFGFRPGWVYAGLGLSCAGLLTYFFLNIHGGFLTFLAAIALATAEQLRLTGRALRQRQSGARIIAAGFALALLAVLLLAGALVGQARLPALVSYLTFPLIFLPPALAISLYLAREFARDAELLQVKLGEVERLSAQTLAQEQDKQALLEGQNELLETLVAQRTEALQRSFTELRATQAQLIQKEKMASLGELTAGIAHEIQNPLNFVTNFADVSQELVAELKEAQAAADAEEVAALADDLTQNLTKISQHGQRAASIVRGMLEHSRASSGQRAPTDVNALADEYLRLAYHGLRAKDKSFNAALRTDLAPGLPPVEGVGADLGRVLLNLFNNAFYAVQQRQLAGEPGYQPTVTVTTRQLAGQVEIRVSDNGTGIPEVVQAKIFQPFFTTKPTGEGTGLGLSLSHDIIVQGHGGTLAVASPGAGTTFTITLPTA